MADPMSVEQYEGLCAVKQGEGHWIKPLAPDSGLKLIHSARKGQVWIFLAEQFGRAHATYMRFSEAAWSIFQLRTVKDVFAGPASLDVDIDKRDHMLAGIRWQLEQYSNRQGQAAA